ncbi:ferritin-like domain-containing protein [Roseiconus lacunae]|uniref:Ferritin-like domain-containing protein n=1 Tax=Roseiconus lacunae TaxID=2605694 RepID=A0ABT7PLS2_9BACT|nr:ferritin-like domain-containing protein [Roseiconus lacunae]MCD0460971.1 ferritin-like domain-containing protein [Roseiconus lacunae]MDM4017273.1 ferritin-like domain-containing protein [Roseiconus lacunae]WRQ48811.1 ferritin-like domain-containing protein [Stieleria sp. HD01]
MDYQPVIDHMNECLKHEWTGVAQYSQASFLIEGVWREVYAKTFIENAEESFDHAKRVGEKISALGGVPVVTRNEIKQTRDLQEILKNSLEFESKAVEMYTKALELAEGDRALVVFLENILEEEQDGVDEFTKLLRGTEAMESVSTKSKSA